MAKKVKKNKNLVNKSHSTFTENGKKTFLLLNVSFRQVQKGFFNFLFQSNEPMQKNFIDEYVCPDFIHIKSSLCYCIFTLKISLPEASHGR